MWSVEELRKRSKELNLLEVADLVSNHEAKGTSPAEKKENDRSPSKSSNSGSQVCITENSLSYQKITPLKTCYISDNGKDKPGGGRHDTRLQAVP